MSSWARFCSLPSKNAPTHLQSPTANNKRRKTDAKTRVDAAQYVVRLFGRQADGRSVSCVLLNFQPSFYLALPLGFEDYEVDDLLGAFMPRQKRTPTRSHVV